MSVLRLLHVFSKPYPADTDTTKQRWSVILVSVFVFLFLFIFQPFGLHEILIYNRLLICLGYGGCTALAMILNFWAFGLAEKRYQIDEKWTVGKHIIWNGWILISIALINFFYSNFIGASNFTFINLLISLGQVLLIGLFPITALVLMDYLRLYRKNMRKARELRKQVKQNSTDSSDFLMLHSSNSDDRLQLNPGELLYITSADNYVKIVYRMNSEINQKLLRGTLKDFA